MLTLIIPTKNRAKFLETLLPTLLSDECPADKILIGNDGSTDNTQEILNRHIKDKKLTVIKNLESIGAIKTYCKLFQYVDTKYCMFMADDDYTDFHLIKKLLSDIILCNSALGFGKYRIEDMGNVKDIIHPGWIERLSYQSDFLTLFAHDHYISGPATIFQTSLLPQYHTPLGIAPFDLNLNALVSFDNLGEFRALDWDLALSMSLQFPNKIYYLDEYVATFRIVDGQLSSDENYRFTGRAAFEMSLLILKYFSNYETRTLFQKNPLILKNVLNLLNNKCRQIKSDRTILIHVGYMPIINAAVAILESLATTHPSI
jgi:glycosyltransferase involved in cell wall biosynthesis